MEEADDKVPAARLMAALQSYQAIIGALAQPDWKMENYRAAADLLLQMHRAATGLPWLHAEWLEVHISHFEFTQALWELRAAAKGLDWLVQRHARHEGALERLRLRCEQPDARRG
ncbi:hypothetical protein LZ009_03280 [Ramlibacter sp. XY19]|uniref:hypothetical protein n=1 Tax=Ramlibacter paludis TaxID=2908000 RepID=UPI0023DC4CC6|nr:hypothetical protein [Ramlibacter paludis]MCG2591795.1 hypothetical protein [Ramlibacter paludis]